LGPYQLAWHLRQHGYQVQVIDFIFRFSADEIFKLIKQHLTPKTQILGIGTMIMPHNPAMAPVEKKFELVLKTIKKQYPNIKIIAGGSGAMRWARQHRNRTLFDYVFAGHAEDSTVAFFNHVYRGGPHVPFELEDGNKIVRESFKFLDIQPFNIEECSFRWHDSDHVQPGESLPLELGRGCVFKCRFCSYPYIGKKKRDFNKSMECVRAEIVDNYERFGVTTYYMLDDTFNADQERLTEFTDMVATLPFKIRYCTYLRPDLLYAHPDSIQRLKDSGLVGAYLGVETLDKEAADTIGKPWSGRHAREFIPHLVHNLWNDDVAVHLGMIAGIPPQTHSSVMENNQWCIDNGLHRVSWHNLGIVRDSFEEHRSEFDINAANYGINWTVRDGRTIWSHSTCDEIQAIRWRDECTEAMKPYQQIACWSLIEAANYGIDIHATRNARRLDFDWPRINKSRADFLTNYSNSIMGV
jgi:hypothetical protein